MSVSGSGPGAASPAQVRSDAMIAPRSRLLTCPNTPVQAACPEVVPVRDEEVAGTILSPDQIFPGQQHAARSFLTAALSCPILGAG